MIKFPLDFFARSLTLRFEDGDKFKTKVGRFLTLFLILLGVGSLGVQALSIYNGQVVDSVYSVRYGRGDSVNKRLLDKVEKITIGFAFNGQDHSQAGLNLATQFGLRLGTKTIQINSSELKDCSNEVYSNLSGDTEFIAPEGLSIHCFDASIEDLLKDWRAYVSISSNCKDCKGMIEYYIFLSGDERDYTESDGSPELKFSFKKIKSSFGIQKEVSLSLSEMILVRSMGFFYARDHTERTYQFTGEQENISFQTDSLLINAEIGFQLRKGIVIRKHYLTFFTALSYLGGLFNAATLIALVIALPIREIKFYVKMINTMFNVCLDANHVRMAMGLPVFENSQRKHSNADNFRGKLKSLLRLDTTAKKKVNEDFQSKTEFTGRRKDKLAPNSSLSELGELLKQQHVRRKGVFGASQGFGAIKALASQAEMAKKQALEEQTAIYKRHMSRDIQIIPMEEPLDKTNKLSKFSINQVGKERDILSHSSNSIQNNSSNSKRTIKSSSASLRVNSENAENVPSDPSFHMTQKLGEHKMSENRTIFDIQRITSSQRNIRSPGSSGAGPYTDSIDKMKKKLVNQTSLNPQTPSFRNETKEELLKDEEVKPQSKKKDSKIFEIANKAL